jgi:hypothetical protein
MTVLIMETVYRISSNKRACPFIFRSLFLKKLFNKNDINSHFSFFFGLIRAWGARLLEVPVY